MSSNRAIGSGDSSLPQARREANVDTDNSVTLVHDNTALGANSAQTTSSTLRSKADTTHKGTVVGGTKSAPPHLEKGRDPSDDPDVDDDDDGKNATDTILACDGVDIADVHDDLGEDGVSQRVAREEEYSVTRARHSPPPPPPSYVPPTDVIYPVEIEQCEAIDKKKVKTVLCHNFMRGKRCRYGTHCAFAHGVEELRALLPETIQRKSENIKAQQQVKEERIRQQQQQQQQQQEQQQLLLLQSSGIATFSARSQSVGTAGSPALPPPPSYREVLRESASTGTAAASTANAAVATPAPETESTAASAAKRNSQSRLSSKSRSRICSQTLTSTSLLSSVHLPNVQKINEPYQQSQPQPPQTSRQSSNSYPSPYPSLPMYMAATASSQQQRTVCPPSAQSTEQRSQRRRHGGRLGSSGESTIFSTSVVAPGENSRLIMSNMNTTSSDVWVNLKYAAAPPQSFPPPPTPPSSSSAFDTGPRESDFNSASYSAFNNFLLPSYNQGAPEVGTTAPPTAQRQMAQPVALQQAWSSPLGPESPSNVSMNVPYNTQQQQQRQAQWPSQPQPQPQPSASHKQWNSQQQGQWPSSQQQPPPQQQQQQQQPQLQSQPPTMQYSTPQQAQQQQYQYQRQPQLQLSQQQQYHRFDSPTSQPTQYPQQQQQQQYQWPAQQQQQMFQRQPQQQQQASIMQYSPTQQQSTTLPSSQQQEQQQFQAPSSLYTASQKLQQWHCSQGGGPGMGPSAAMQSTSQSQPQLQQQQQQSQRQVAFPQYTGRLQSGLPYGASGGGNPTGTHVEHKISGSGPTRYI